MRISRWPVLVCGWILAAVLGQTAVAFQPPDMSNGVQGEGAGYAPGAYADGSGGGAPGYGGYFDQGMDYPANPWPAVSPYSQNNMEELYNDRGLWQFAANSDQRKHILSADFLLAWGLRPGNQLLSSGELPASTLFFDNGTSSGNNGGGTGNTNTLTNIIFPGHPYPTQKTNVFSNLQHYGVRLRYGWENPDESGMVLSGFYLASNQVTKVLHPNSLINSSTSRTTAGGAGVGIPDPLVPLASIAYNNGYGGVLALFDSTFVRTYDQQFWGADADIYISPFLRRDGFKMALTYGVKYFYLSETLGIHAEDSGQSGNLGPGSNPFGPGTVDFNLPIIQTWVTSQATSNLVGPQIGVRYDFGGEYFKIWGQSKVAVAANIENLKVYGKNAYGNLGPVINGGDLPFNNTRSVTHISPIFDQSVYIETPIFRIIPVVNKMTFFNTANFRFGYNFLLVGEVSRPANMIDWNLNSPSVQTSRTWFSLSTLSFGMDWKF
ncbi:MAG: hypothetical protein ACKV0T_11945 [Planctomycetales bacterium]